MDKRKRQQHEKKFGSWETVPGGGRRYWYDIQGRHGWKARYIKEVDANEVTLQFVQEIYNDQGELVEVHQKFPVDTGHRRV